MSGLSDHAEPSPAGQLRTFQRAVCNWFGRCWRGRVGTEMGTKKSVFKRKKYINEHNSLWDIWVGRSAWVH